MAASGRPAAKKEQAATANPAFDIPDPLRPAFLHRGLPGQAGKGRRWTTYQERRSIILAAARRAIVHGNGMAPCLQTIAALANVSVPTIYNLVGNRTQLMQEAGAEWTRWLALAAMHESEDVCAPLAVMETFWTCPLRFHEFTEGVVRAAAQPQSLFNLAARHVGTDLLRDLLIDLGRRGMLRSWVDIDRFAFQTGQAIHFGIRTWAINPYDSEVYRSDFANGPALMLLGAVCGSELGRAERHLAMIAAGRGVSGPAH